MTATRVLAILACLALAVPSAAVAGEVRLTMRDGLVTLVARDATVRQILTEWARVGKTRVVNVERVPGGPVSIELKDVPEAVALATVLRSIAGYMAAPRVIADASLSRFDRIVVMPTLAPATQMAAASAGARPAAPPAASRFPGAPGPGGMPGRFPTPPGDPGMGGEDPDDMEEEDVGDEDVPVDEEEEPVARPPIGMRQPGMMPASTEPPPHPTSAYDPAGFGTGASGQAASQPGTRFTPPAGAAVPGMVTPAPATGPRPSQTTPPKPPGVPR